MDSYIAGIDLTQSQVIFHVNLGIFLHKEIKVRKDALSHGRIYSEIQSMATINTGQKQPCFFLYVRPGRWFHPAKKLRLWCNTSQANWITQGLNFWKDGHTASAL